MSLVDGVIESGFERQWGPKDLNSAVTAAMIDSRGQRLGVYSTFIRVRRLVSWNASLAGSCESTR